MGILSSPYCWRYRNRSCLLTWTCNLQRTYRNISMTVFVLLIHLLLYCLWLTMTTVTVILLKLWFIVVIMMMIDYADCTVCTLMLQAGLFIWDYLDCWCIWWCDDYLTISITYYLYCILVYVLTFSFCAVSWIPLHVVTTFSFIPPDTSHIFRINCKIFMGNLASSQNILTSMDIPY